MSRVVKAMVTLGLLAGALSPFATAAGRNPASVLIFPEYLSSVGSGTILSVTNTKDDPSFNPNTNLNGVVDVHFIYVDGEYWTEFNRYERLTPMDTFTVRANVHNPNSEEGFLYCIAESPSTREPVSHNWLIGDEIVADGSGNWLFGIDAIGFKCLAAAGDAGDANGNGLVDLDGIEYEAVADQMMISSFQAQAGMLTSSLILVSLVPSSDYETRLDLSVYNNNEVEFSAAYRMRCWAWVDLTEIDSVFLDTFLKTTSFDSRVNGLTYTSGWARIDGDRAIDVTGNEPAISDPPFVGVFVQSLDGFAVGHLLHESKAENETPGQLDALL